jgi:hypothetical protein
MVTPVRGMWGFPFQSWRSGRSVASGWELGPEVQQAVVPTR